ncbi:arginase family protein, partial [Streptococcus anginosus]|nr:arginase family protein [Streptococcus anginosus]
MEAVVPNSEKMDEINVPVSLEKNGDKTSQIDDEAALIKQIQAAQVILEDRNPAKVITIGGDCSTS